jgi:hypothetical protein
MGEQYDPHWNFTVDDLLSYNLGQHSLLINTVYQGAVAEYDLEQKLNRVKKYWEEKQFKLAKHIPDSVYAQGESLSMDYEISFSSFHFIMRGTPCERSWEISHR